MTKVHFHQLQGAREDTIARALQLVCELANEAGKKQHSVLIYCPDAELASSLEQDLWQHIPSSFLAHSSALDDHAPIYICRGEEPGDYHDMMINLDSDTPSWFSRFEHLAELIYGDEALIQSKRERFAHYKHLGYPLSFSKVESPPANTMPL
ncbi:MAG: DNA polymerase III subunit chi [Gammaproteobacteria bacterium]|nr:DNA polymerase III subunit chi [Gammaproteobacteria bacterium]MBQ0839908.1 DNA polymerase III subunit chi [Gammaproteobacteria bacterium]